MRLFLFSFLSVFCIQTGYTQILILSDSVNHEIINEDVYFVHHTILGKNVSNTTDTKYEFVVKGDDYTSITGRIGKKKIKPEHLTISDIHHGFYSGIKYVSVIIPPETSFGIYYTRKEPGSVFFSSISKDNHYPTLQHKIAIKIPPSWKLTQRDSSLQLLEQNGFISLKNIDALADSIQYPIIVHPYEYSPNDFFNDWFFTRIEQLNLQNPWSPEKYLTGTSPEETTINCLDFVTQKIKYIDIEDGIGAVIPFSCPVTMRRLAGDCKDMANVLTNLLRSYGIEAYNAISRTNAKKEVFDFPSISLANHMITVAVINNQYYFLDPTEDHCTFGLPSLQTIDTDAFILNEDSGEFTVVPSTPANLNSIELTWSLNEDYSRATFQAILIGKANDFFRTILYSADYKKQKQLVEYWLKKVIEPDLSLSFPKDSTVISFTELITGNQKIRTSKDLIIKHPLFGNFQAINDLFISENRYLFPLTFTISLRVPSLEKEQDSIPTLWEYESDEQTAFSSIAQQKTLKWSSSGIVFPEESELQKQFDTYYKRFIITKSEQ